MPRVDFGFEFDDRLDGQLQVNGRAVLNGTGSISLELAPGKHIVQWFLLGDPGKSYTVAITSPDEAKFEYKGTMTKDRKTAGSKKFEVTSTDGGE